MLKKTAIASLAVGLMVFIGVTAFTPPETDCGCPPEWTLTGKLRKKHPEVLKRDLNGDRFLCYKVLPVKAEGNAVGRLSHRNYKNNNQPCDD